MIFNSKCKTLRSEMKSKEKATNARMYFIKPNYQLNMFDSHSLGCLLSHQALDQFNQNSIE